MQLTIYTDGGYKNKKGSWAFYVVEKDLMQGGLVKTSKSGSYEAELSAVLQALIYLSSAKYTYAKVYTDHHGIWYMINNHMKNWESNADIRDPIQYWGPIWSLYEKNKQGFYWVSNKNKTNGLVDRHCTKLLLDDRHSRATQKPRER